MSASLGLTLAAKSLALKRCIRTSRRSKKALSDTWPAPGGAMTEPVMPWVTWRWDRSARTWASNISGVMPWRATSCTVGLHIQGAIGSTQRGDGFVLLQIAGQALVAGVEVQLLRGSRQHAIAHHALKRRVARFVAVEQLGVDGRHGLAQALGFGLVGLVPFELVDVDAVHRGHGFRLVAGVGEALHAEQHEAGNDQDQQEAHQVLLVIADGIEHALKS
jgi:hypothetical protein